MPGNHRLVIIYYQLTKIMTKNVIEDGKDYLLFFPWPPSPGTSLTYLTLHLYMT